MPLDVQIKATGPLFDGRAVAALKAFIPEATAEIGQEGVNEVRGVLASSLRNPTGFYESQIQTNRVRESNVVSDGGVIYGPWLEGVSRRNATTGFKGYSAFRRSTQALNIKASSIAQGVLPPFLRRMN